MIVVCICYVNGELKLTSNEKNIIIDVLVQDLEDLTYALREITTVLMFDVCMFFVSTVMTAFLLSQHDLMTASGFILLGGYSSYMTSLTKESFFSIKREIGITQHEIYSIKSAKTK